MLNSKQFVNSSRSICTWSCFYFSEFLSSWIVYFSCCHINNRYDILITTNLLNTVLAMLSLLVANISFNRIWSWLFAIITNREESFIFTFCFKLKNIMLVSRLIWFWFVFLQLATLGIINLVSHRPQYSSCRSLFMLSLINSYVDCPLIFLVFNV